MIGIRARIEEVIVETLASIIGANAMVLCR